MEREEIPLARYRFALHSRETHDAKGTAVSAAVAAQAGPVGLSFANALSLIVGDRRRSHNLSPQPDHMSLGLWLAYRPGRVGDLRSQSLTGKNLSVLRRPP